jgi:hypothetical protein
MAYLLTVLEPRGQRSERTPEQGRDLYQRMLDFGAGLQQRGLLIAAEALRSESEGFRLTLREGERRVVDGPFTEAREMIGGFFLIEVSSRDEALAIAAECPAAQWATIEVRETGTCYE